MTALQENLRKAGCFIREHGVSIAAEVLVNFAAPFLIYDLTRRSLGDAGALIASSGPPIAWSLLEFARRRRVDAVSMLVVAGIALSLLAFIGGGGARFLQLRENLVNALVGLVFLGSAAIGKPLIYQLARATLARRASAELGEFEQLRDNPYFRRSMTVMTLVWGVCLLAQTALASALIFVLSIREYLLVNPVIGYGTLGALGLWTAWYAARERRKGLARRAAQAQLTAAPTSPSPDGVEA